MMWPFFARKRHTTEEIAQAQEASSRATEVIREVNDRREEVDTYYKNLRSRKLANNFGPALMRAMEKKSVPADS